MSTEKYRSLTAYAIYLIVSGCESPLELKRCSRVAEGQLCKGSNACLGTYLLLKLPDLT